MKVFKYENAQSIPLLKGAIQELSLTKRTIVKRTFAVTEDQKLVNYLKILRIYPTTVIVTR